MVTSLIRPSYHQEFYSPERGGIPLNPNLWNGLLGAWMPLLGGTGSRLVDISGFENHGVNNGATWLPTGALLFNGSSSWIDMGDVNDIGTGDFTTSVLIKADNNLSTNASVGSRTFQKRGTGTFGIRPGWFFNVYRSGGQVRISSNSAIDDNSTFAQWPSGAILGAVGEEINIIITYDRDGLASAYCNGILKQTLDISAVTGSLANSRSLTFGASDITNVQFFGGQINSGMLWKGILPLAEIMQLSADRFALVRTRRIIGRPPVAVAGRIMSSLANAGGLAGYGGIAGQGGGLAGQ